jgi:hypothetical protein
MCAMLKDSMGVIIADDFAEVSEAIGLNIEIKEHIGRINA